jgi:site-specific DNA recombinase
LLGKIKPRSLTGEYGSPPSHKAKFNQERTDKMAERVYCLYRVSTAKQVDHDDKNNADIPMQRKACHEFANKMGWEIVGEEQETGVSGYKVSANDRDKLQLIKKYAEQGKFDILLVFMFDRLGRKSDETPFVVEWFVKKGIRVWSVNEGEQRFESHTDRLTNYIRFW